MEWNFRSDLPIYSQLVEQIQQGIVSGALSPGQRLPSVRDMAMEAGVNPNTMQRALQELERQGLVYAQRTAGRFVTEDTVLIGQIQKNLARVQVRQFWAAMEKLGCTKEEVIALLREEEESNADT